MGSPRQMFKKKVLAASVAALASVSYSAVAQDGAPVEEVLVTGIRASLENAMDIKRESSGVVDAISAEDMGKFPDTNLAESLQRITGVSISRNNGEGAEVTVRGFASRYNMITLNGRTMPGAVSQVDGAPGTRSFDFSNIASEGVSGVEVYKTGKANIAAGGVGATINIKTARPFDAGTKGVFGVKAVKDTTAQTSPDVTPEYAGMFSWVNDEDNFGVLVNGSYQERNSTNIRAYVVDWFLNKEYNAAANVEGLDANNPYYLPSDLRYSAEDQHRVRKNAQAVLQWRPVDSVTTTLDYTYAANEIALNRAEQSTWYEPGNITDVTFDGAAIQTPVMFTEDNGNKDISFAQRNGTNESINKSLGFNVEWEASEIASFTLDYHNSSAEFLPKTEYSVANASIAAFVVDKQGVDFRGDLPLMAVQVDDSARGDAANGVIDETDMTTTRGTVHYVTQKTDIEQLQLDGKFDLDPFTLTVGVETRKDTNLGQYGNNDPIMGDWGGADPDRVPDEFFSGRDYASLFADDFDTAGAFSNGQDANFSEFTGWAALQANIDAGLTLVDDTYTPVFYGFPKGKFTTTGKLTTNRLVEEETVAAFAQLEGAFDIGPMEASFLAGLRYEETDVTSTANVALVNNLLWEDDDDFNLTQDASPTGFAQQNKYDHLLPSLDFKLGITDDLVARVSYSKTIARPTYGELGAAASIEKGDLATRSGSAGNPKLEPTESDNFDISVEWYYDDASYVSAGYFIKDTSKFIGNGPVVVDNYNNIRDVRKGPRYEAALAQTGGDASQIEAIFDQMLVNDGQDPSDESTFLAPNGDDPFVSWTFTAPVNNQDAKIQGLELAVQHMFFDSGFGVQANYTLVDSDKEFDVLQVAGEQFAVEGLSDTANLVAFYDNYGFQARIAYNWRDEYLESSSAGGAGVDPSYVEAYSQIDMQLSYDVTDNLNIFAEGINLTEEDSRVHMRSDRQLWRLENLGARYQVGARYSF